MASFTELEESDWKYVSAANLFAGLAYIFTDVATTGEINVLSVGAFVLVLFVVLGLGYLFSRKD
jgi:hypothetical protein